MNRFVNKGPERYQPFKPAHPRILSHVQRTVISAEKDGLFYLQGEQSQDDIQTITNYQQWCEVGWKQQHGTYEAASRFVKKLQEETGETYKALDEFRAAGSHRESEEAVELLSELGDVLWGTTALASNSSADIDSGLRNRLSDYAVGVLDYSNGYSAPTRWREKAGSLSHQFRDISFKDIDDLVDEGFEPLVSPVMNIYDHDPQFSLRSHVDFILANAAGIAGSIDQQYGYGELEDAYIMPATYDAQAVNIAVQAAEIYLNVAYAAKHELGLRLQDVVKKNMAKINGRIQAGRIDKTDGERDANLL